jgi:hypothetical protein
MLTVSYLKEMSMKSLLNTIIESIILECEKFGILLKSTTEVGTIEDDLRTAIDALRRVISKLED